MLSKLLKHEFRATGRIMGPLYLVLLVVSAGANGSIRLLDATDNRILNVLGGLLMALFVICVIGVCIITLVLMINRFRTNLLGDEGYVMFTLPASVHQQVWSKIIVSTAWAVVSGIAVSLALVIATFRVHYINQMIQWMQQALHQITTYYALNGAVFLLELLILLFTSCAAFCLQFYAAMSVGHSFVNHKTFFSVVFFFVFQFALQFLGLTSAFSFEGFNLAGVAAVHTFIWVCIAVTVAVGAVFYVITTIFLKKHLNLE